jgi:hypothetical protein
MLNKSFSNETYPLFGQGQRNDIHQVYCIHISEQNGNDCNSLFKLGILGGDNFLRYIVLPLFYRSTSSSVWEICGLYETASSELAAKNYSVCLARVFVLDGRVNLSSGDDKHTYPVSRDEKLRILITEKTSNYDKLTSSKLLRQHRQPYVEISAPAMYHVTEVGYFCAPRPKVNLW